MFNKNEKAKWADLLAQVQEGKHKKKMDPVDKDELKGDHEDRDDKDIDNDGDVDSSDKYLHKRRKAVSKAIKKDSKDVETEVSEVKKESTKWPVYTRIMEKRDMHYKGATDPQAADDNYSQGAKDFVVQHDPNRQPEDYVDINKVVDMNKADMEKNLPGKSANRPNDKKDGQPKADTPEGKDKL